MVRAVDGVLKTEFSIASGLSARGSSEDRDRVQILDPAAGTGTFLVEIIKYIHKTCFAGKQEGGWLKYVQENLVPRLFGFEIEMVPYAIAHLQLWRTLYSTEEATNPSRDRFHVYLTNALEENKEEQIPILFAGWLSKEVEQAQAIKQERPIMVVIGNPPYKAESQNKNAWVDRLMEDYKKEPGKTVKIEERNPKWINDDYAKFIRFGQHLIDKNEEGILAFINAHGFLSNPTFRGMRYHLMRSFSEIYIIDLHGNKRKKETAPGGSKDEGVFNIMQGVSINIFVKKKNKPDGTLATVHHHDLYGTRAKKFDFLQAKAWSDVPFRKLQPRRPHYFMVPKDYTPQEQEEYNKGFPINKLFPIHSVGMVTGWDHIAIQYTKEEMEKIADDFSKLNAQELRKTYPNLNDKIAARIKKGRGEVAIIQRSIRKVAYRPFDTRYTCYTGNSGFLERPRHKVMRHFVCGNNVGIVLCRQITSRVGFQHVFIADTVTESSYISNKTSGIGSVFPLHCYPDDANVPIPNLCKEVVQAFSACTSLRYTAVAEATEGTFSPIDILDYVYALLYSPTYRARYQQLLKEDFPKVPYPASEQYFRKLVALGAQLRWSLFYLR